MTSHTIKVNGRQMSVITPLTVDKLLVELSWKWPNSKIELVLPVNKIKNNSK